jgi:diguanylate cyclase (GGDEF)-like protein
MTNQHPGKHRSLPTISAYGAIFIALVLLLLGGITVISLYQLDSSHKLIHRNFQTAARQELQQALQALQTEMLYSSQELASWDEARQNLSDSTYYIYWRESRALSAGVMRRTPDALALFDKSGSPLSKTATVDIPPKPPSLTPEIFAVKHDHRIMLYSLFPIWGDSAQRELLGYGSLGVDLLKAWQSGQGLNHIHQASLELDVAEGVSVSLPQLGAHLRYQLRESTELNGMEKLLKNSLYQIAAVVALLSGLFYLSLISLLARPLQRMSKHIDALRDGRGGYLADSYREGALPIAELEKIRSSLNDYQKRLDDLHIHLESKNTELWSLAHHDLLTGIHNRRAFEDDWQETLSLAEGKAVDVSFILFDCDHFKAINDTYGHSVGDLVLQGITESLQRALRSGDRLYRLGGDEFAMLLLGAAPAQAIKAAERCMEEVYAHNFSDSGVKEPVRISIGLAHVLGTDIEALNALQKCADIAMYYAKRPDHSKIAVYADTMVSNSSALVSNWVANAVYEAIARKRPLEMHYQPIVHLPGTEPAYYEALVRIREGDELIMPGSIFPVVESRRLEAEFDIAIIEQISHDLSQGLIPAHTGVSINISGPSIILNNVLERLEKLTPFLASYKIVLEVTETALITQITRASSNLTKLREAGFIIALDDFGSGYSSLMYLSSMPVDLIKFDISLIQALNEDDRQGMIVENLARLISKAGYDLLAEGIETQEAFDKVKKLGFSHAQGYYLGRPEKLG